MSMVQLDLPGARVLDLFAGSGALGLEALSRGAAAATFVERHPAALRALAANLAALGAGEAATIQLADVLRVVSELAAEAYDVAFADPPYRQGLARAFRELVRSALEEQPVFLAVDDAEWLDRDSLLVLGAALRDLAGRPLGVLLTTSPRVPAPELDELRARIGRDLPGAVVVLKPFDVAALRVLARHFLPAFTDVEIERVTRRVGTDSAGVPVLAVELLRAVALGMDLGSTSGAWPEPFNTLDQTLPGDLPDAVVSAIRIDYRRLSRVAQQVLAAAAVLDDRCTPELLARAVELSPAEIAPALDELEWQRWLVSEPRGYGLVARIVRQVIAADLLTPGQRRRILERVGHTAE